MKSTLSNKIVVFILLIFHAFAYSQYRGGIADGSVQWQITNLSCGLAPGQFAYTGGGFDGSSANTKTYADCGFAPGSFAYMGGINDGSALHTKMYGVCADPPQFYTYYGGNADGSSMMKQQYCALVLPVADFTANPLEICVNQNVTFTDASSHALAWEWTVTGGTFMSPSTNNSQNPVVKYATAGTYAVTLKVQNTDGENTVTKTAFIKVNASASISSTTPGSRCGAGSVNISATPNSGTIKWYNASTGGTLLFTGNNFTTPSISTSTTYYAEAYNGCTASTRTAVLASVNSIPTISGSNVESCGPGSVTLTANPSAGTVKWYDAATGGNELGTGTTYTTPNLSATKTYYAETTSAAGCTSNRIAVDAIIKPIPVITSTTPAVGCGSGQVTISAAADMGSINWYDSQTGGTWLYSGNSWTMNASNSTTYWVGSTLNGCNSARVAVTVTINTVPTINSTSGASLCGTGSLTLNATASSPTIKWFDAATGGTELGSGTTFTTPILSNTTTYYVETTNGTCTSVRSAVVATINHTAAPTGNTTQQFCPGATIADLVVYGNNVQWYDLEAGGSVLPSSTPLVNGTVYYASQWLNGCESETRLAVTASQTTCLANSEAITTKIKVYPVPVSDVLYIDAEAQINAIEIYAASGQKILAEKGQNKKHQINVSRLSQGVYVVKIFTDRETKVVKIIKK